MVYVPVPQNLIFFPKNPSEKRLCLSMWEWPNLFSLVKSIFIGQIFFHWSNLFFGIYDVSLSATKIDFFPKNPSEKRLCLSMWEWPNLFSLIKSIFIGQIFFHWSHLFCGIYYVSLSATKIDFFLKNPSLKKGFVFQCGSGRIFFH